uniref:Uncharacterized protein n=1 Tax=Cacopsylla melanoneura TaxID=428564 RepID=A0A8D8Q4Q2_9HEMI
MDIAPLLDIAPLWDKAPIWEEGPLGGKALILGRAPLGGKALTLSQVSLGDIKAKALVASTTPMEAVGLAVNMTRTLTKKKRYRISWRGWRIHIKSIRQRRKTTRCCQLPSPHYPALEM